MSQIIVGNRSIIPQKWPQISIFPTQFKQIAMLNLKKILPAEGGKARFARKIFPVAKIFINLAPGISVKGSLK